MKILIKNGRMIDPSQNMDRTCDLLIEDDRIGAIYDPGRGEKADPASVDRVIDASGMWVVPGLIDLHVHFREPGLEYKEDISTGCRAAAAGGFTAVCTMPNTLPFVDSPEIVGYIREKEAAANGVKLLQSACITKGQKGRELTDMAGLKAAGVIGFSEDGRSVDDLEIMREGMKEAARLDLPVLDHTEEKKVIPQGACMNAGETAGLLGLPGIPAEAEELIAARDILLAKETGCRLHLQHISTRGSLDIIKTAKAWGIPVTAETAPHYFTLTDRHVPAEGKDGGDTYHIVDTPSGRKADTHMKMNPPLRSERDVAAMIDALIDGTIDCISTDHAPHSVEEKSRPMDKAAFGIIGLETSFAVSYTELVKKGYITPMRLIALMSTNPARIAGHDGGSLRKGCRADVTIIDPETRWTVDPSVFRSKGRNTPFEGRELTGQIHATIADGRIIYSRR